MTDSSNQPNPSHIMQVGLGFWASKTLLSAVKFDLFTILGDGGKTAREIQKSIQIHDRGLFDFLDTLTALGFLRKEGTKEEAKYHNTPDTQSFLVTSSPMYLGGLLNMANHRLYQYWGSLEEALKTGEPQNESKLTGKSPFESIYSDPDRLNLFIEAMSSIQKGNFMSLAHQFDFSRYKVLCDVGGSGAALSIAVANHHSSIQCINYDLPPVSPIAQKNIDQVGLNDRIKVQSGDFFKEELPKADVITMGNILHDWGVEAKLMLIQKAYNALPENGAFIAIENIIDNDRKEHAFGLMMSLNMLIETPEGFDYTADDFDQWAKKVGFKKTETLHLGGPASAVIAYK